MKVLALVVLGLFLIPAQVATAIQINGGVTATSGMPHAGAFWGGNYLAGASALYAVTGGSVSGGVSITKSGGTINVIDSLLAQGTGAKSTLIFEQPFWGNQLGPLNFYISATAQNFGQVSGTKPVPSQATTNPQYMPLILA